VVVVLVVQAVQIPSFHQSLQTVAAQVAIIQTLQ
jgi:hypothetical protein